ncbi:MAG: saccharopine dehydrogenase family protein [Phycisphaerales bacterium]
MPSTVVLGAGMVGSVIAADLAAEPGWSVRIVDRSADALAAAKAREPRLESEVVDCADQAAVARTIETADVVCGALASHLGFAALRTIIETGRPYADISFMAEDAIDLDPLAVERNVPAVVDCGVAPGMSNLFAGEAVRRLDQTDSIRILVGGIPEVRHFPFEYKAGFAPSDVIEEYLRPARIVTGGETVVREALSEIEPIEFPGIGTLEAFNTDGLRSLAATLDVPEMIEKTMRWPGHATLMRAFRDAGFLSDVPVEVDGKMVRPRDLTERLIIPRWTFDDGEVDLTVMRVEAHGRMDGRATSLRWDLHDRADTETKTRSMSRTTAFPCALFARMLAAGRIDARGVLPPERLVGESGLLDDVLAGLEKRGVRYTFTESTTD